MSFIQPNRPTFLTAPIVMNGIQVSTNTQSSHIDSAANTTKTTGNQSVVIIDYVVPAMSAVTLTGVIVGINSTATDSIGGTFTVTGIRANGNATVNSSNVIGNSVNVQRSGVMPTNITFSASGTNLLVSVTGAVGMNYTWNASYSISTVTAG